MSDSVELQTLKRQVQETIRRAVRQPDWRSEDPATALRARDRVLDRVTALVTADQPVGTVELDWGDDGE